MRGGAREAEGVKGVGGEHHHLHARRRKRAGPLVSLGHLTAAGMSITEEAEDKEDTGGAAGPGHGGQSLGGVLVGLAPRTSDDDSG